MWLKEGEALPALAYSKVTVAPMRFEPSEKAEMVSELLFGAVVEVKERKDGWLKVMGLLDDYVGWVDMLHLGAWEGAAPEVRHCEFIPNPNFTVSKGDYTCKLTVGASIWFRLNKKATFGKDTWDISDSPAVSRDTHDTLLNTAAEFMGAPYLWGGKTPYGVDCSGLIQILFRTCKILMPRDAHQQATMGKEVKFSEATFGDLVFFANEEGKISHVGMIYDDEATKLLHASGWVRVDDISAKGLFHGEKGELRPFCMVRRVI